MVEILEQSTDLPQERISERIEESRSECVGEKIVDVPVQGVKGILEGIRDIPQGLQSAQKSRWYLESQRRSLKWSSSTAPKAGHGTGRSGGLSLQTVGPRRVFVVFEMVLGWRSGGLGIPPTSCWVPRSGRLPQVVGVGEIVDAPELLFRPHRQADHRLSRAAGGGNRSLMGSRRTDVTKEIHEGIMDLEVPASRVRTLDESKEIPQERISERIWKQVDVDILQEHSSERAAEQTVDGLVSRVKKEIVDVVRFTQQECIQHRGGDRGGVRSAAPGADRAS